MESKSVSDNWERGDLYEQYVGRWSRGIARQFLDWLNGAPGGRWLDVGCGTGALSAAIVDRCAPRWVAGIEPSAGFLAAAGKNLAGRAVLARGAADRLPLADSAVDWVVSGLVLNFTPDPPAALAEMARVSGPGGGVAAYVWDYSGKMELMRYFWDAAVELDPYAGLDEGRRFPMCTPEGLRELFAAAGLREIETAPVDTPTNFASFEEYWRPFLGGQGPAPAYVMALDPTARDRLRRRLRQRLPTGADGSISLTARAWAVRAAAA